MFERFTDRARKVMAFANQEAMRLNHQYVGTEHMLLGLLKEGTGVGATVLKNLDIDLRAMRREVEKLAPPAPDIVTMGKMPQSPCAKKAIGLAIAGSKMMGHNYIGTEHLLLGVLGVLDGHASAVLSAFKVTPETLIRETQSLLGVDAESVNRQAWAELYKKIPPDKREAVAGAVREIVHCVSSPHRPMLIMPSISRAWVVRGDQV